MSAETIGEKLHSEHSLYRVTQRLVITGLVLLAVAGLLFRLTIFSHTIITVVVDWLALLAFVLFAAAVVCWQVMLICARNQQVAAESRVPGGPHGVSPQS